MREMLVKSARNRYQSKVLATAVFLPVMPIGVEQIWLLSKAPILTCVLTCDADRR